MRTWLCSPNGNGHEVLYKPIVVLADLWEDARFYAFTAFTGADSVECKPYLGEERPTVQIRWVGSDANHGGSPLGRRREVRRRTGDTWTEWERS
jgi:hypothetical protein